MVDFWSEPIIRKKLPSSGTNRLAHWEIELKDSPLTLFINTPPTQKLPNSQNLVTAKMLNTEAK